MERRRVFTSSIVGAPSAVLQQELGCLRRFRGGGAWHRRAEALKREDEHHAPTFSFVSPCRPLPGCVGESLGDRHKRAVIKFFRRTLRLAAFAVLLLLSFSAFAFFLARGGEKDVPSGVRWLRWMLRCALCIVGGRLRVEGRLPRSGLIVSNHLSYIDIAALGAACPCSFVSKAEVRKWPFIGWAAGLAGTVFVRRAHRSEVAGQVEDIKRAIARGVPIVLFPEGTSTDGSQVLPFRSALLQAALETGCDVTPAALCYRADPPGETVTDICWWGGVGFLPHLWRFLAVPSFEAEVVFGDSCPAQSDRKAEAVVLRERVVRLRETACSRTS